MSRSCYHLFKCPTLPLFTQRTCGVYLGVHHGLLSYFLPSAPSSSLLLLWKVECFTLIPQIQDGMSCGGRLVGEVVDRKIADE